MNSDKFKGVVEIEILGEVRGFKFGMAAMVQLLKLEATDLKGVQEKLALNDISTMLNLIYSAAVQYAKLNKKVEPSYEEVANWIDHLDGKEADIIKAGFAQPDPNPVAP